mgnify:FL=1
MDVCSVLFVCRENELVFLSIAAVILLSKQLLSWNIVHSITISSILSKQFLTVSNIKGWMFLRYLKRVIQCMRTDID